MPATITDLDAAVIADHTVKLGGREYKVPASPPMPYFLWMNGFIDRFATDKATNDDLVACYDHTAALLAMRAKGYQDFDSALTAVKAGKAPRPEATIAQCITFYNLVYLANVEEEEAPKGTGGATTGSSKRRGSRSRS